MKISILIKVNIGIIIYLFFWGFLKQTVVMECSKCTVSHGPCKAMIRVTQ